jgi:type I site-specific restriction endonuclease
MAKKTAAKKNAKRPSIKKKAPKKASTAGAKRLTTKATEQDFETEIRLAVRKAFPWLKANDVKHQVKFFFNVGHAVLTVDGKKTYRAEGRADVLIETKGSPLAILELKRPGNPLTSADELQGLSYARLLPKMAPLVLVTNGTEARLIATHSGKEWNPPNRDATQLANLLKPPAKLQRMTSRRLFRSCLGPTRAFGFRPFDKRRRGL